MVGACLDEHRQSWRVTRASTQGLGGTRVAHNPKRFLPRPPLLHPIEAGPVMVEEKAAREHKRQQGLRTITLSSDSLQCTWMLTSSARDTTGHRPKSAETIPKT